MKKNKMEKWGVENPFQLDSVKEKIKKNQFRKFWSRVYISIY